MMELAEKLFLSRRMWDVDVIADRMVQLAEDMGYHPWAYGRQNDHSYALMPGKEYHTLRLVSKAVVGASLYDYRLGEEVVIRFGRHPVPILVVSDAFVSAEDTLSITERGFRVDGSSHASLSIARPFLELFLPEVSE